jgi:hypothetical protein
LRGRWRYLLQMPHGRVELARVAEQSAELEPRLLIAWTSGDCCLETARGAPQIAGPEQRIGCGLVHRRSFEHSAGTRSITEPDQELAGRSGLSGDGELLGDTQSGLGVREQRPNRFAFDLERSGARRQQQPAAGFARSERRSRCTFEATCAFPKASGIALEPGLLGELGGGFELVGALEESKLRLDVAGFAGHRR